MNARRPIRPNGLLGRFVRDQRGVSAIIFAILLPTLIAMVGLSVEVGAWYARKRSLQAAADAAAMAGALDKAAGSSNATVTTTATSFATRNGWSAGTGSIDVNIPPESGAYTADTGAVEVLLTETQTLLFSALLRTGTVTVNARAVATAGTQALGCVIALNSSANAAVHLDSNAEMELEGCGLTVNSSSSNALQMDSNSEIEADFARITGSYDLNGNATLGTTPVSTGATAVANPYASLANPTASGACTYTNYSLGSNQTATIGPGRYCGGFNMNSNSTATMTAGTYYIDGGTFNMNSNTSLTATAGVTIILTGSGADWAELNIDSNAQINIIAPNSGTYEGIAIMQDQDAPSTAVNTLNSNVDIQVEGSLYFPNTQLQLDSNARIRSRHSGPQKGCALIIADTISMNSNSQIEMDNDMDICDTRGVPTTSTTTPALVE